MQTYIRVISDSGTGDADDLRLVIDALISTVSGTSEYAPMKPHGKGGFSIYLEYPDDEVEAVFDFLTSNDWMPCF